MAIFTTADGRQIVGAAQAGNEYKGYAGRREIVIQLTATGATQDSLDALEFLKSYAVYHNSVGEPIFPASTNVFISNNGVTKAVEADEVTVDGANVNIGGCVWNGTAWDFTNAGQSGGGGSTGGGVLVVHDTDGTLDKTFKEINDAFTNGALPVVIYDYMIWYPSTLPVLSDLYLSFKAINLTAHNSDYSIYAREYIAESETSYPVLDA